MNAEPGVVQARRAHSARCRQRVIKALDNAVANGEEITISAITRKAGVDRSFLYRHRDLHAQVMAKAAEPPASTAGAHERITRLDQHNRLLQRRLSELLGEHAWRESGLGAPADINALQQQIIELEQKNVELQRELAERQEDLEAARATNRELITKLNRANCPANVTGAR